jgi:DNA polymerase III epsilon subunit-like protein
MPGFIVIDTETNKLPIYKKPDGTPHEADAEDQPRMAEFAMVKLDQDFNKTDNYQTYIFPQDWEMLPDATEINNLTTEFLIANGKPVEVALNIYTKAIEAGYVVISHNAQFDCKILRGELRRANMPDLFWQTKNICTMRSADDAKRQHGFKISKMNHKGGSPRLIDLANHLGCWDGREQHKALEDAEMTAMCAKIMAARGWLLEAKVHEAKKHPSRPQEA